MKDVVMVQFLCINDESKKRKEKEKRNKTGHLNILGI